MFYCSVPREVLFYHLSSRYNLSDNYLHFCHAWLSPSSTHVYWICLYWSSVKTSTGTLSLPSLVKSSLKFGCPLSSVPIIFLLPLVHSIQELYPSEDLLLHNMKRFNSFTHHKHRGVKSFTLHRFFLRMVFSLCHPQSCCLVDFFLSFTFTSLFSPSY